MGGSEAQSQFTVSMSMLTGGVGGMTLFSGVIVAVLGLSVIRVAVLLNRIFRIGIKSPGAPLEIQAHFDELTLSLTHKGEAPELPEKAPKTEMPLDHPECFDALSGYLIRSYTDTIRIRTRNGETRTRLNFDH